MTFDARQSVQDALDLLAVRLDTIISRQFAQEFDGGSWTSILVDLDRAKGIADRYYSSGDLQVQLRMLTERLGSRGFPFETIGGREVSTLGSELRIVRNRWAHNDSFTALDAWRVHDFVRRLLVLLRDAEGTALGSGGWDAALAEVARAQVSISAAALAPPAEVPQRAYQRVTPLTPVRPAEELKAIASPAPTTDDDRVDPDSAVFSRMGDGMNPTRWAFEPWRVVLVGDASVFDDLSKKYAKEQVRAVIVEIVEFEGPIHIDRLAMLTAASFGLRHLHSKRQRQLVRQIEATGFEIDEHQFVWPSDISRADWTEFRPNSSDADRPFVHISPTELANAARFLRDQDPMIDQAALEAGVLQTFGRMRPTRQVAEHLDRSLKASGV
ncbi:MAG: DUF3320 domain-containing protein [Coriobacteriia bacterium]|nr:DUF3320 domain-containing protein [Coriobacteriia bacterium]